MVYSTYLVDSSLSITPLLEYHFNLNEEKQLQINYVRLALAFTSG
jgi:hypothetical protein